MWKGLFKRSIWAYKTLVYLKMYSCLAGNPRDPKTAVLGSWLVVLLVRLRNHRPLETSVSKTKLMIPRWTAYTFRVT